MRTKYMIKLVNLTDTGIVSEVIPVLDMIEAIAFMRGYFAAWIETPTPTIPMLVEYQEVE